VIVTSNRERAGEELDHEHFLIRDFATLLFGQPRRRRIERSDIRRIQWRVRALLPEFERTSGIKVTTGSGASQGQGRKRLPQPARGVPANVVILSREGLSELIAAGTGSPPEQTWILRSTPRRGGGRGLRSPT
jgi:hypothetical protein